MKTIGFSIFPGWIEIKDKQIELIKKGRELGYTEIFFGIGPGSHWRTSVSEAFQVAKEILRHAEDYYTFVDINPEILKELNASPKDLSKLKEAGFKAVRPDYGFTKEEIVEMSKQMYVELNPMEITDEEVDYVLKNADPERIKATHNYYPVKYSGMTLDFFEKVTKRFKEKGIKVGAFIAHPNFKLRTTVEILRDAEPYDSANFLFQYVDRVLFGDPIPEEKWLINVAEIARSEITPIRIKLYNQQEDIKKFLSADFYVNNYMEAGIFCIRKPRYDKDFSGCYTKVFKNGVAILGRNLLIFTKDLDIGPFTLIGEINEINLRILEKNFNKWIKIIF